MNPVQSTTGTSGRISRKRAKVSSPSMKGMVRSRRTRSQLCGRRRNISRHSKPDCAVSTWKPASQSRRFANPTVISSSSTARMVCRGESAAGVPFLFSRTRRFRDARKLFLRPRRHDCASSAVTFSARSMLVRNMARYFSEPSVPSQMFSMTELVPAIIWSRLFSSLVALEIGSGASFGRPLSFASSSTPLPGGKPKAPPSKKGAEKEPPATNSNGTFRVVPARGPGFLPQNPQHQNPENRDTRIYPTFYERPQCR